MSSSDTAQQIAYDNELIEEVRKAKSQWKRPPPGSVFKAIFLSYHYTWMWQPFSLILAVTSFYLYKFMERTFEDQTIAYANALWWPSLVLYW